MGIKFLCPNGHKLNVKSFLSGKKAICPKCGVRVLVPSQCETPGGAADPASMSASIEIPIAPVDVPVSIESQSKIEPIHANSAAGLADQASEPAPLDPLEEAPSALWYVRPPTGGQFGPASNAIMRAWVHEGRVGASSLVWRAGWAEWRPAATVFSQLAGLLAAPGIAFAPAHPVLPGTSGALLNGNGTAPPVGEGLPVGHVPQSVPAVGPDIPLDIALVPPQAMRRRRRKNDTTIIASAILVVVSIILVISLVFVLNRNNAAAEKDAPPAEKNEEPDQAAGARREIGLSVA